MAEATEAAAEAVDMSAVRRAAATVVDPNRVAMVAAVMSAAGRVVERPTNMHARVKEVMARVAASMVVASTETMETNREVTVVGKRSMILIN
ncbi:hypothetical protein G7Z17_g13002 [Cylindrodendrum hubeiense]|uniref:Uncharacterized protein n=1 Tax=Cylindrodendrum hubeiense TaxID=595255 RepID=A0A9P5H1V8_9HYPO|nr:hypothetical protein G7Z17_g13002 [Cylindrodendrum hubeiense]